MKKRNLGIFLVTIGMLLLMISFVLPTSTIWWAISLGVSIISNLVGVGMIMKFLNETPNKSL